MVLFVSGCIRAAGVHSLFYTWPDSKMKDWKTTFCLSTVRYGFMFNNSLYTRAENLSEPNIGSLLKITNKFKYFFEFWFLQCVACSLIIITRLVFALYDYWIKPWSLYIIRINQKIIQQFFSYTHQKSGGGALSSSPHPHPFPLSAFGSL